MNAYVTAHTLLPLTERCVNTLTGRWYVFVFLLVYLCIAVCQLGWRRTALFTLVLWPIAFLSEYSSIRNGFPYGLYNYLPEKFAWYELWLGTEKPIPFFDSLSYTFLNFTGYGAAIFFTTPRLAKTWNTQLAVTHASRRRLRVLLLAATLTTLLDVIIDPIAHRGDKWFLGRIYEYVNPGVYFDVPLSNFAGWWITSIVAIGIYMLAERFLISATDKPRIYVPLRGLLTPGLWLGIAGFNIAVTLYVAAYRETMPEEKSKVYALLGCSSFWAMLFLAAVWLRLKSPKAAATAEERAAHFADFPDPALARRLGLRKE